MAPEAAEPAQVAAAIDKCPSGAPRHEFDGATGTDEDATSAAAAATIRASLHGPLLVEGDFDLLDENGGRIETAGRAALCRCGGTGYQPFCDGTHRRIGFESGRIAKD